MIHRTRSSIRRTRSIIHRTRSRIRRTCSIIRRTRSITHRTRSAQIAGSRSQKITFPEPRFGRPNHGDHQEARNQNNNNNSSSSRGQQQQQQQEHHQENRRLQRRQRWQDPRWYTIRAENAARRLEASFYQRTLRAVLLSAPLPFLPSHTLLSLS